MQPSNWIYISPRFGVKIKNDLKRIFVSATYMGCQSEEPPGVLKKTWILIHLIYSFKIQQPKCTCKNGVFGKQFFSILGARKGELLVLGRVQLCTFHSTALWISQPDSHAANKRGRWKHHQNKPSSQLTWSRLGLVSYRDTLPNNIILPTQTMQCYKGTPFKLAYICIVWSLQNR